MRPRVLAVLGPTASGKSSLSLALAERYRGEIDAAGLESKAKMAKYEGDQALYGGLTSAGVNLLDYGRALRKRQAKEYDYGTGGGIN